MKFGFRENIQVISDKKLRGTTMAELLVVMIVSGILFLLLFDGLSIVQQYGRILDKKLFEKSGLLYSHQVFEALLEKTDSIRRNENELCLYMSEGSDIERLYMDSACILFHKTECTDTLFTGLINIELHAADSHSSLIDSLFLSVRIGKDTVRLEYGLSSIHRFIYNEYSSHDIHP